MLRELTPAEQLAALARRELDVGVLRPPLDEAGLETQPLLEEPLVAALPADHRLAAGRTVALADLAGEPFVLFPRRHGPGVVDVVLAACREAGFAPRVVAEPDQMHAILALVAAGVGVSVVPASLTTLGHPLGAFRPLRRPAPRVALALAWLPGRAGPLLDPFRRACAAAASRARRQLARQVRRG